MNLIICESSLNCTYVLIELMPGQRRLRSLLKRQYAAVGAAAGTSISAALGPSGCYSERRALCTFPGRGLPRPPDFRSGQRARPVRETPPPGRELCRRLPALLLAVNSMEDLSARPLPLPSTEARCIPLRTISGTWNLIAHLQALRAHYPVHTSPNSGCDGPGEHRSRFGLVGGNDGEGRRGMVVKPLDFVARESGA